MSLHGVPHAVEQEYFGLAACVKAAATWAGKQEAWMADAQRYDCQSIEDMKDAKKSEQKSSGSVSNTLATDRQHAVWTHQLVTAEIQPRTEGRIFGCLLCGAFAWKRRGKLVETCPRRPTTQYMRAQLDKLKDQCFPGEQRKALGPLRQPEPAELEWLARCDRAPQGAKVLAAAVVEEKSNQRALTRQELLREFGITYQGDMDAWTAVARANPADEDGEEDCSDSD